MVDRYVVVTYLAIIYVPFLSAIILLLIIFVTYPSTVARRIVPICGRSFLLIRSVRHLYPSLGSGYDKGRQ